MDGTRRSSEVSGTCSVQGDDLHYYSKRLDSMKNRTVRCSSCRQVSATCSNDATERSTAKAFVRLHLVKLKLMLQFSKRGFAAQCSRTSSRQDRARGAPSRGRGGANKPRSQVAEAKPSFERRRRFMWLRTPVLSAHYIGRLLPCHSSCTYVRSSQRR